MALPTTVYSERRAALQGVLKTHALDAVLLTDEANMAYFVGFVPEHFFLTRSRMVALIVPAAGPSVVIAPTSHLQHLLERAGDVQAHGYEGLRGAPVAQIAQTLQQIGAREVGAELGIEMRVNCTIGDFDTLRSQAQASFQDASALIWGLRLIKTDDEIRLMEQACLIGERAYARCLPTIRAGERERDVAARLAAEVALAGGRLSFLIMTSGAGNFYRSNGAPSDRILARGDFLFVDLGVRYEGYHSDFNRCLIVGEPTPDQVTLQDRVIGVSEAAARYLVPGVEAREVYARVLDDCGRAGLSISAPGRIGHGIGLGATEPPHLSAEDPLVLETGMVVTVEPALERDDGLFCAECIYVVQPAGGRRLNHDQAQLIGSA